MNRQLLKWMIILFFSIVFINNAIAKPKSLMESNVINNVSSYSQSLKFDKSDRFDRHGRHEKHNKHGKLEPSLGLFTTTEGSMEQKNTFGLNETPYAFMQFYLDDLNTDKPITVWWKWKPKTGRWFSFERESISDFSVSTLNIWQTPEDWEWKAGEYSLHVTVRNPGSGGWSGKQNITVTPEPLSYVLFVVGGAVLTYPYYRKKRKHLL
jgi:hypothetical protein